MQYKNLHYLCTRKQEISLRQIKIHRGMEQLVARRAHNPKVVWFESHSRYSKGETRCFSFFRIGSGCYLSPKPPFCKGGLFVHSVDTPTSLQSFMNRLEIAIFCSRHLWRCGTWSVLSRSCATFESYSDYILVGGYKNSFGNLTFCLYLYPI